MLATLTLPFRLVRVGYVFAREGVLRLAPTEGLPLPARLLLRTARLVERSGLSETSVSDSLSGALNRLGPSYVKLGQFMATRPDVVGKTMAAHLEQLQDRIADFGDEKARLRIEQELGRPVSKLFSDFSTPVAAASIAQVHKATIETEDGPKSVAVKVLRPGVRRKFRRDLKAFLFAARMIELFHPPSRRLRPVDTIETLARSVDFEMDFRFEAAALSEMADNVQEDPGFHVPDVFWERSGKAVLTLEWVDGIKLTDLEAIEEAGLDRKALAAQVMQSFLRHAMRDGFFHADMHPGNLFVADGDIVAVDFGIMGRLPKHERRALAEILYGFITRDYRRVSEVHFEVGYVPPHQDVEMFAQALRSIGEPLQGRNASEISMARLLGQLFEFTDVFDMKTQPQLLMLQKTMVVTEGVARMLDPDLNMWKTAEPVVRDWMTRNLGPAGRLEQAADSLGAVGRLVESLPELAERAERLSDEMASMAETGFRLAPETVDRIGANEARRTRSGRIALWVIAAALAALAVEPYLW
ncbi:2-polyprenylphenol 6-hydroxylase [Coralliovum pocilloporae]|uniref:2-polyprenylphenol 6-hydroxylase n=1 Tax=Coralliovum pocilloporae TaxID=3066369 RepID=UPI0033074969